MLDAHIGAGITEGTVYRTQGIPSHRIPTTYSQNIDTPKLIHVGNLVRINGMQGSGRVLEITTSQSVIVKSGTLERIPVEAKLADVVREFEIGDSVEVKYGEHTGVIGIVGLVKDDSSLVVVVPREGIEV